MDERAPKIRHSDLLASETSAAAEPSHDAWARAKIEAALKEAIDRPQDRVSLSEAWRRFGLEH